MEYRPEEIPAAIVRLGDPETATLIFGSGKLVCTGAKSEQLAKLAVYEVMRQLVKAGLLDRSDAEVQIRNVVASTSFDRPILVEAVPTRLIHSLCYRKENSGERCLYNNGSSVSELTSAAEISRAHEAIRGPTEEDTNNPSPEAIEYALCKAPDSAAILFLFKNGKAVLTSVKSEFEAQRSFDSMADFIEQNGLFGASPSFPASQAVPTEPKSLTCSVCGSQLRESDSFCRNCGARRG